MLSPLAIGQEVAEFKTFSYTAFFQMIEDEEDSVFVLKNAIIVADPERDSTHMYKLGINRIEFIPLREEVITIDKSIELDNVHFAVSNTSFNNIRFTKKINFKQCGSVGFLQCTFEDRLVVTGSPFIRHGVDWLTKDKKGFASVYANQCKFKNGVFLDLNNHEDQPISTQLWVDNSEIHSGNDGDDLRFWGHGIFGVGIDGNTFFGQGETRIVSINSEFFSITGNKFNEIRPNVRVTSSTGSNKVGISDNSGEKTSILELENLSPNHDILWDEWLENMVSSDGYRDYVNSQINDDVSYWDVHERDSTLSNYLAGFYYQNKEAFRFERKLRGSLFDYFKSQHDIEAANHVFINIKDLETKRLRHLFLENRSFDTYFQWKVNQFLKLFSDYGTKPSKAIVFAVYVIAFFAAVYLFFPNHWDSHGKNRIKHRYLFFLKYLSLNKGIHDVYKQENEQEIKEGEDFRAILEKHKLEAPAIFYRTAMPLYRWSVAGTRMYSGLLRRVDFLKGTWKETDSEIRPLKTALVVAMFGIALVYDIFIKVLNAVMLSINTFTTLGFGEIPIKGLPRYLAIVQGFVGWFMLTIFSVSLISQLLN